MDNRFKMSFILSLISMTQAVPIVLKESTPNGEAIIAISSSDPEVEKYLRFGFSENAGLNRDTIITNIPEDIPKESVGLESVNSQVTAASGRGFASNSAVNPFLLPFFFTPINLEGLGLSNYGALNWLKGVEGFYEHEFPKNGEIKTVAAVNDNGHVFGNIKTLTFDNKARQ